MGDARGVASFTHGGQILPITATDINDPPDPSDLADTTSLEAQASLGQLPTPSRGPVVRGPQLLARGTQGRGDLRPGPALFPRAAYGEVLHLLGQQPQVDSGGQGRRRLPQLPQP